MDNRDDWLDPEGRYHPEGLDLLIQRIKQLADGDTHSRRAPDWDNWVEQDEECTSRTAFQLLGVVLGNTLGFDLNALIQQAAALKQLGL